VHLPAGFAAGFRQRFQEAPPIWIVPEGIYSSPTPATAKACAALAIGSTETANEAKYANGRNHFSILSTVKMREA
jgi:hypothetical protein